MDWIWREKEKVKSGSSLPSNGRFPFLATMQEKILQRKTFLTVLLFI